MSGQGPPPKDPATRARRNKTAAGLRVVEVEQIDQPSLYSILGRENPATGEAWTKQSLAFWVALGDFPTTRDLQQAQWELLARAVMLDDAVVRGQLKHAAEARLQLAKFGVAPDDVARLRIQFANADTADTKASRARTHDTPARQRRGPLTAV